MPPNKGELTFEELESTFDAGLWKDPKDFLIPDHDTQFGTKIKADETKDGHCTEGSADLKNRSQDVNGDFSDNYWEWPSRQEETPVAAPAAPKEINKEEFIKQILYEEEIRQLLMVEQVEKRLVDDMNTRKQEAAVMKKDSNRYKNEAIEKYWYWEDGETIKDDALDLKVDSIEKKLLAEAQKRLAEDHDGECKIVNRADVETSANDYWDWKEEEVAPSPVLFPIEVFRQETNKEELLRKILLEEEIRQGLMVTNIEKSLLNDARLREEDNKEYDKGINTSENAGYWDW